ncbi:hypothetical protein RSOLAG1IB_07636 [Rhizoctonia solani AG-1 IB]|uniref:Arrestin-like N-terminal domain-containing protein n=1 Tax=Thanatephorus cucumeris (strain AG1-IB / isolate 7/3/14) TaxID=1108050 RepID=A0A0B7FF29_THACB|nr:hypothetical protein RSOLAG1IB_07636 [Rhizoctonia solani AG-1 IB]
MAAPCYTDSGYSAPTSPPYSASVTDGERILELRSSLSTLPNDLPDQYVFQSQRIKLDLGARIWPTRTPCFGYMSTIEGTLSVTTLDHVKRLTVVLDAVAKSSFMERGVLTGHREHTLFQRSVTLYTNTGTPAPTATLRYPFSMNFPPTSDKSTNPPPPSFVCYLPGVSTEVRYCIRIEMSRSGLRRRESLMVPILYLPRSHTPPAPSTASLFSSQSYVSPGTQVMKELHLAPKSIASAKKASKTKAPPTAEVQAKIALPSPLVVASGDRIPFVITIYSPSQALAALYTNIGLQLVRITRIKAHEKISLKEVILAAGEVYEFEEPGNGIQILRGELGNGKPGAESTWFAGEVAEVKHMIRLSIKPSCTTSLSSNLPMFDGIIAVNIMTHRYNAEADTTVPALGMIGISTT